MSFKDEIGCYHEVCPLLHKIFIVCQDIYIELTKEMQSLISKNFTLLLESITYEIFFLGNFLSDSLIFYYQLLPLITFCA